MTDIDPTVTGPTYAGQELPLFAAARNWKAYLRSQIVGYLEGDVLEVGAGMGATTRTLWNDSVASWTCLEPDARLLEEARRSAWLPRGCTLRQGTLETLSGRERFDAVLYIDVLEHIEDDVREVRLAAGSLNPGGHLVVLAPAHPWLFTPFDESIGHHRRYTAAALRRLAPSHLEVVRLRYLDAVGLLLSLGNKLILRQSMPTARQLRFWDRVIVRASRIADPATGWRLGKSVLGVWRRRDA